MPKSVLAAAHFHDEAAAFAYLENKLWPSGPVCPRVDADGVVCEGEGYALNGVKDKKGRERLGLKKCRKCRSQFTLRIGTIFEDSHAPLHIWLQAIALMAASKKGVSSNQLHRVLGVQLKTAWHMSHRIRMAMAPARGSRPARPKRPGREFDSTLPTQESKFAKEAIMTKRSAATRETVFVAGGVPTYTYVTRSEADIENDLARAIAAPFQIISLHRSRERSWR